MCVFQPVRTLPVDPGPGAEWAGSGVQPAAGGAEGAAAATAPHSPSGAVLQWEVPEKRAHQAGISLYILFGTSLFGGPWVFFNVKHLLRLRNVWRVKQHSRINRQTHTHTGKGCPNLYWCLAQHSQSPVTELRADKDLPTDEWTLLQTLSAHSAVCAMENQQDSGLVLLYDEHNWSVKTVVVVVHPWVFRVTVSSTAGGEADHHSWGVPECSAEEDQRHLWKVRYIILYIRIEVHIARTHGQVL